MTLEVVLRLGKQLAEAGLKTGVETISWHLEHHPGVTLSGPGSTRSWPAPAR